MYVTIETIMCALIRWNNNSIVSMISNHLSHTPIGRTKRYDRKLRNPAVGGVDLFDNAINNNRIEIRGTSI